MASWNPEFRSSIHAGEQNHKKVKRDNAVLAAGQEPILFPPGIMPELATGGAVEEPKSADLPLGCDCRSDSRQSTQSDLYQFRFRVDSRA